MAVSISALPSLPLRKGKDILKKDLKHTNERQDLGIRATNLRAEKIALEIENEKLMESQKKTEEYNKRRCNLLEERCQIYEKNKIIAEEEHQAEIARLKKLNLDEIQLLRKDFIRKTKELDDCTTRINTDKNSSEDRIKKFSIDLNDLRTNKEQELQDLEKRLRNEYSIQILARAKALESRISLLEKSREDLTSDTKRNVEEFREKEKMAAEILEGIDNEIAKVKEELYIKQKENEALKNRVQQAQNEQQMNKSTMERFDSSRNSLSKEIKNIKDSNKAQIANLKIEQEKERRIFEQTKAQLNARIKELEYEEIRLKEEIMKTKQEANEQFFNLRANYKEIINRNTNDKSS